MTVHDEIDEYEGPSRSQRKRDAAELKELGDALVAMPASDLAKLPLSERLADAIELQRRITAHGGRARQRQLIGKLLRHEDTDAIRAAIDAQRTDARLAAREFHRIETWRDRLLSEGDPAMTALLASHPELDAQRLRTLVMTARHEADVGRPPAAARELFRWLREALAQPGESA
jgi:ribosome-associated protein